MKRIGFLLFALALAGCGSKQHNQARAEAGSASVSEESALTGQPAAYPRAVPVVLPVVTPPASAPEIVATTNAAPATPQDSGQVPIPSSMAGTTSPDDTVPTASVVSTPSPAAEALAQVVVLETSFGRMVLELDNASAPKTCENFRNLVANGFYNGTIFHRIIPHFIIQGGDPNTKTENRALYGRGDPGYTLPPEIGLHHDRGAVAMARLPDSVNPQRNSNGSQFYICLTTAPSLDDQYTVFAHVIQGMNVADRIAGVPRDEHDDPLERINMQARLESKDQALRENPAGSTAHP